MEMGIHCEINLRRPANEPFVTGSLVAGNARYNLDKDIVFNKITISLKGRGRLDVQNMRKKDEADGRIKDEEGYVKDDIVILNDIRGHVLNMGSYDTQFCFKLPFDIPPSLDYIKSVNFFTIRCKIIYYLQIVFVSSEGYKRFKTEIKVSSGINSNVSTEPRIYDKQRKLIQLLRNSFVTVKATINNPVVIPGGKVELTYEVFNDTNVNFKSVESKLVEETYLPRGHYDGKLPDEIVTDITTSGVRSGESQTITVEVPIPADVNSIGNCKLIAKDYFVKITVYLPLPYRNVSLKIPVQIGEVIDETLPSDSNRVQQTVWEVLDEVNYESEEESLSDENIQKNHQ